MRASEREKWSLVLNNLVDVKVFYVQRNYVTESYIVPGVSLLPAQYYFAVLSMRK
jgi:hypothetical protein